MFTQQEVEHFVIQKFAVLQSEYNFKPPKVKKEGWITRIDFIKGDIAIEVELDWREFDVFLLIVRLEAGKLPQGYYISDGKRCRQHLLTLIKEKRWPVDQALVSQIRSRARTDPRKRETGELKTRIASYQVLLLSCLSRILAEESLFDTSQKSSH